ncbi:MAG: hydrolase [Marmoricola sp.]|nr:hydrolase [Marmoricola sp.]
MPVVVGVAIMLEGRVLAARRAYPPDLAGGWEFPGGKVAEGEDPTDAAVREIREELGCEIAVTGWLSPDGGSSAVSGRSIAVEITPGLLLRVATADVVRREPVPVEHDIIRWLRPDQLDAVDWLPADVPFLEPVRELLSGSTYTGWSSAVETR